MVESIKELRKICQSSKVPHDCGHIFYFFKDTIWRYPSIYVTKLFLYTPITANQVTMLMIFLGFLISFLFSFGNYLYSLIAAILLEFVFVLDGVDGEIARYRKQSSINGVFLDLVMHIANVAVPFMGITIGLYMLNPGLGIVILGLSASLFAVAHMDIQTLKHHAFFIELVKYAKKQKEYKPQIKKEGIKKETTKVKENLFRTLFKKIAIPFYDNFLITQIIVVGVIFNKLYWVLTFYGLTFPIIWLIKLVHEYRSGYNQYEYLLEPYKCERRQLK